METDFAFFHTLSKCIFGFFDGLIHHVCEFCVHCREAVWVDGVQKKWEEEVFFLSCTKVEMLRITLKYNFVNRVEMSRIKSTLLVPQIQWVGATEGIASCPNIRFPPLLHPFNFNLYECGHLFHGCVVFPSGQTTFLAQSLQSPNTDNYTVFVG